MILSKKQKDDIIHRALTDTFSETSNKIIQQEHILTDAIYNHYFPQELIEMMSHFPEGVFTLSKEIYVDFDGNAFIPRTLSEPKMLPKNYQIRVSSDSEFYTQHMEINQAHKQLATDYYEMKRLLLELFSRKSDDMEIAEEWPGIMNYVEDYVEEENISKDPTIEKSIIFIEEKYKLMKEETLDPKTGLKGV